MFNVLFIFVHLLFSEIKNNQMIFGGNKEDMSKELNGEIIKVVKPLVEKWAKINVSSDAFVYGIRRYLRGAWLALHVDGLPTNVLSAVLQVVLHPSMLEPEKCPSEANF